MVFCCRRRIHLIGAVMSPEPARQSRPDTAAAEKVVIRPVDERDVGVDVAQRPRRRQTGEAAADNDDLPPLLSDASGNSFLERPCGEGHHQNESYEQDAVDAAVPKASALS